jgi:predicted CXXCH cytochrome family protein
MSRNLFKSLRVAVIALLLAAVSVTLASVVDTKHNLSATAGANRIADYSTNEDQVCIFCHTPHQAAPAAPLWNHRRSLVAAYGVYQSPTLNATDITDIGGGIDTSNLCMSCHDGTIAVNDLVVPSARVGVNPTMGSGHELDATGRISSDRSANLGSSLSNDHPVNFTYNAALATADTGLVTPFSTQWVDAARTLPLFGGKLQCASCHDPHDSTNEPFLNKSNQGSQLCLTCHVK